MPDLDIYLDEYRNQLYDEDPDMDEMEVEK
jgi:hypothetical protein